MVKQNSLYSPHPSIEMVQKWIVELKGKTGRSLEQWLKFINREGPASEAERRAWLKAKFQVGAHIASWLAERSAGKGEEDGDPVLYLAAAHRYVEDMFAGKRAGLRPIYDALLHFGLGFAADVKACPCKTIVPFYRRHVFAQIKPATNTRIDMGFALKDTRATGRLIDTGGFAKKDRITHRIPISMPAEFDDEVRHWFQVAYDMDRT
jgi:hypothetical protein